MKIALVNFTGGRSNWGCQATSHNLLEFLQHALKGAEITTVPFPDSHRLDTCIEHAYGERLLSIYQTDEPSSSDLRLLDRLAKDRFGHHHEVAKSANFIFFQGEGSIGPSRYFRNVSLFGIPFLAKKMWNKPVLALNQTLYAANSADAVALCNIFKSFDLTAVREMSSYQFARKIGLDRALLCPDLAFDEPVASTQSCKIASPYFCVSGSAALRQYDRDSFAKLITAVARKFGMPPLFLASTKVDREFFRTNKQLQQISAGEIVDTARVPQWPGLLPILGKAAFLIGGRYHTAISALSQGTPVVLLPGNTFKSEGIGQAIGLPLPIFDPANQTAILDEIGAILIDREGARRQIASALAKNSEKFSAFSRHIGELVRNIEGGSAIAAQPDTLLSPEMAASAEQSRFTDFYRGRNQSAHVALRRSAILLYAIARRLPNFRSSVDATFTKLP